MADHLDDDHDRILTNQNLHDVYVEILQQFDRFAISATFAFVMAMVTQTATPPEAAGDRSSRWLQAYDFRSNDEGWHYPELLDLVRANAQHEVASHGFTHLPLGSASAEEATYEFEAAREAALSQGIELTTLVYPRNQIAFTDIAESAGFSGYRGSSNPTSKVGKIVRQLSEANLFERSQPKSIRSDKIVEIPPGWMINWQSGLRRVVPPELSRIRWRRILRDASERGHVAHLWLHPHNMIESPGTARLFEILLSEINDAQHRGDVRVLTQAEYVEEERAESASGV